MMKSTPKVKEAGGVLNAPKSSRLQSVLKKDLNKHWFAYMLAIPVLVWYIVFCYGPMWGVAIAFKDFKPLLGFAESFVATYLDPGLTIAVNFALFLFILIVRPNGLFGRASA